jgi:hypothetical protein
VINLGDAPASVYLDTLFTKKESNDVGDALEPTIAADRVSAASLAVYEHVPFTLLLDRYLLEWRRPNRHQYQFVRDVVTHCIHTAARQDPVATVGHMIDALIATPPRDQPSLSYRIFDGRVPESAFGECFFDDVLGRLDARLYAEVVTMSVSSTTPRMFPRVEYLTGRIHEHRGELGSASAIALALATDWNGTLDELFECARTLSTQHAAIVAAS